MSNVLGIVGIYGSYGSGISKIFSTKILKETCVIEIKRKSISKSMCVSPLESCYQIRNEGLWDVGL